MAKKLIYLIQEKSQVSGIFSPLESFDSILDATTFMDREAKANPDISFKLIQIPFTPKD